MASLKWGNLFVSEVREDEWGAWRGGGKIKEPSSALESPQEGWRVKGVDCCRDQNRARVVTVHKGRVVLPSSKSLFHLPNYLYFISIEFEELGSQGSHHHPIPSPSQLFTIILIVICMSPSPSTPHNFPGGQCILQYTIHFSPNNGHKSRGTATTESVLWNGMKQMIRRGAGSWLCLARLQ